MKFSVEALKKIGKFFVDNQIAISAGTAVSGVFLTALTAHNSGQRAYERMLEEEAEKDRDLTFKEKVKTTWTAYIPTVASVGLTLLSMTITYRGMNRQIAAITTIANSLLAYLENSNNALDAARELLGPEREDEIKEKMINNHLEHSPIDEALIPTIGGTDLCFDDLSGRYFYSCQNVIDRAANEANKRVIHDGYLSVNAFYMILGLEPAWMGEEFGWNGDHLLDIRFMTRVAQDGRPCLVVTHSNSPMFDYLNTH